MLENNHAKQKNIIYTDGASSGNPGPGGWGAVIRQDDHIMEIGGGEAQTTNNRMEMTAAIRALAVIDNNKSDSNNNILLYTDSQYLINGITKWVYGWQKNDWKTKEKKNVLNKDLWLELIRVSKGKKIKWIAVKGHSNLDLNNRVDEIAVYYSKNQEGDEIQLFDGQVSEYTFEVTELSEENIADAKDSASSNKNKKAYSYLSMIGGQIQKHQTWEDCKNRVDGKAGAKFRKSINPEHEQEIIKEWES